MRLVDADETSERAELGMQILTRMRWPTPSPMLMRTAMLSRIPPQVQVGARQDRPCT